LDNQRASDLGFMTVFIWVTYLCIGINGIVIVPPNKTKLTGPPPPMFVRTKVRTAGPG